MKEITKTVKRTFTIRIGKKPTNCSGFDQEMEEYEVHYMVCPFLTAKVPNKPYFHYCKLYNKELDCDLSKNEPEYHYTVTQHRCKECIKEFGLIGDKR